MWKTFPSVFSSVSRRLILNTVQARLACSPAENPLFEAAAGGDISAVNSILESSSGMDVNVLDRRGWTALMIAARYGQKATVESLLQNGADWTLVNKTGQSAFELAAFWRQKETADVLKEKEQRSVQEKAPSAERLHRHSVDRCNAQWLNEVMQKPDTIFIALHAGSLVVIPGKEGMVKLSRFSYDQMKPFISEQNTVFLGVEGEMTGRKPVAYFCVDLSATAEAELLKAFQGVEVIHVFRLLMLTGDDQRLIVQARPLLDWHRNQFCPRCGSGTAMDHAGYKRVCLNSECATHKRVHNVSYPRVDPTVICTVISSDGSRCLLAHKLTQPSGMYSCVAGFVEPGETLEEACIREVEEEVGLVVSDVRYHSSQPWPMPSSLMIGYRTRATTDSEEIRLDEKELEDARWFGRDEVVLMLTRDHPQRLFVPPVDAVAHHLIKAWVMDTAFASL